MNFHLDILDGCQLTEWTRNSIAIDQREITKNIQSRVIVLVHDILSHCALQVCEAQPNSFNSVQLTERTQNFINLCYKGNNLKNIHAKVMVFVLDTKSKCPLKMYDFFVEISVTMIKLKSGHDFVTK